MSTIIDGTTGITTDGLIVGVEKAQLIKLATSQATTSGTTVDFTSIPTWAKKITIMFSGVSTTGTSSPIIQIGLTSVETSGYLSSATTLTNAAAAAVASYTSGFGIGSLLAANTISGHITLITLGSNVWTASGTVKQSTTITSSFAGDKTTSGVIDRVRITTVGGTDTFDAGSINILIEGSI